MAQIRRWTHPLAVLVIYHVVLFTSGAFLYSFNFSDVFIELISLSVLPLLYVFWHSNFPGQNNEGEQKDVTLITGRIMLLVWLILFLFRIWQFDQFSYEAHKTGFSSALFAIKWLSWFLLGLLTYHWNRLKLPTAVLVALVIAELGWVVATGIRTDVLIVLLLILLVTYERQILPSLTQNWRLYLLSGLAAILLLLTAYFLRTDRVDDEGSVTLSNEISQIDDYLLKSAGRFVAPVNAYQLVNQGDGQVNDAYNHGELMNDIKIAFTPRILDSNKPSLRPGNEFAQIYLSDGSTTVTKSYPTGLLTDFKRVYATYSWIALLISGGFAVFVWYLLMLLPLPYWMKSFIFMTQLSVGGHLIFWLTGWIRLTLLALVLIGSVKVLNVAFKKLTRTGDHG